MPTRRNLRPTEGARFLLERVSEDGDGKSTYTATVFTPEAEFAVTAQLAEDGTAQFPATGAAADLDERLQNIAKLLARDAPKRREDGLAVWPQRILRWRK